MDALVQSLQFPSSALLAIAFLLTAYVLHRYAGRNRLVSALKSPHTSRMLLAVGAVILAIEGTWSVPLHSSALFLVYALLLLLALALTLLQRATSGVITKKSNIGFLLNHLGIFLIIWAALLGAPDVSRSKMIVERGQAANYSFAADGTVVPLPFSVALEDFRIDYYDDGKSPRQFTSDILVDGEHLTTQVNAPASYQGYTLYQDSYDRAAGRYTVLQIVRDPWLPIIYIGMMLLAAGSILLLFGRWKTKWIVPVTLLLTAVFTALTVAKINFGMLMPALRSWWFVPHLFIYMVAYSLMAIALILWLVAQARKRDDWQVVSDNLVRSSSALLIIGMLTGSVWARQAWGDYWAWDPKENWAAVTWFVTLIHLHLYDKRGWRPFVILVLAFLALQITWYGVNYLPSAMDSMHTYTK